MKKLTFWQRVKFGWVAFKNAKRAVYGIPISIETECGFESLMPSQVSYVLECTKIKYLDYNGNTGTRNLKFF